MGFIVPTGPIGQDQGVDDHLRYRSLLVTSFKKTPEPCQICGGTIWVSQARV